MKEASSVCQGFFDRLVISRNPWLQGSRSEIQQEKDFIKQIVQENWLLDDFFLSKFKSLKSQNNYTNPHNFYSQEYKTVNYNNNNLIT